MAGKISRRNLFRLKPTDYVRLWSRAIHPERPAPEEIHLRPPGAPADEATFLSLCQRCRACSAACPFDVIEHLGPIAATAEGTPVVYPDQNPCRWCPEMHCVHACPSGALRLSAEGHAAPIGTAQLNLDACLTAQGILCDACALHCPTDLRAITMTRRRPALDPARCTGCGLCVYYCEADPAALSIVGRMDGGSAGPVA